MATIPIPKPWILNLSTEPSPSSALGTKAEVSDEGLSSDFCIFRSVAYDL